jgi:GAF domain-containing protein
VTIERSDASLGQEIAGEVARASDKHDAMTAAVRMLKENRPYYTWVGIYVVEPGAHEPELVLGPFIGKPSPHTRIPLGRGICGAAATQKQTIIVDDVNSDPRYLACSIETKSEIVVPIMDGDRVLGEIDIDSDTSGAFGEADQDLLERVAQALAGWLRS